jgi:hypothetical protein
VRRGHFPLCLATQCDISHFANGLFHLPYTLDLRLFIAYWPGVGFLAVLVNQLSDIASLLMVTAA